MKLKCKNKGLGCPCLWCNKKSKCTGQCDSKKMCKDAKAECKSYKLLEVEQ